MWVEGVSPTAETAGCYSVFAGRDIAGQGVSTAEDESGFEIFGGGRFAADAECHRAGEPVAYSSASEIVRDGGVFER